MQPISIGEGNDCIVERFHNHLKSALMARLTGPDWVAELPWVLLGIRTQGRIKLFVGLGLYDSQRPIFPLIF